MYPIIEVCQKYQPPIPWNGSTKKLHVILLMAYEMATARARHSPPAPRRRPFNAVSASCLLALARQSPRIATRKRPLASLPLGVLRQLLTVSWPGPDLLLPAHVLPTDGKTKEQQLADVGTHTRRAMFRFGVREAYSLRSKRSAHRKLFVSTARL